MTTLGKMLTPAAHRYVLELPSRNINHLHNGSKNGYWQIVLEEKDREKTAFITKYGLIDYTKMPFGLCSAPSTFQRCMELRFRGMQWKHLLVYLDGIIIFSQDM